MKLPLLITNCLICCILLCIPAQSFASLRRDSLSFHAEWIGVAATKSLQPLWQYANKWGVFSPLEKSESVLIVGGEYGFICTDKFELSAGVGAVAKNFLDDGFLHQGYISGRLMMIDFEAGMRAYTPIAVDDRLTTGNFLMSSNARPIPKIGVGFFDYVVVPFTGGHIGVKGAIYQGWPLNDSNPQSTKDVWLHEKFAYIRWQKHNIKPYAGLVHSAYFGGIASNGVKIEKDFWATFTASGSAKLGGGEETNAAGAHMGLWDFGIDYSSETAKMKLYYMKPFADGSGMRLFKGRNKDHILGLYYRSSNKHPVSGFSLEYVKTDYQSGEGLPDPFDPDNGIGVWPGVITDNNFKEWMAQRFPDVDTDGWNRNTVYNYLRDQWNYGHPFGGRDTYLNNGMYYQGWTHKGLSSGTALFHTAEMANAYAPQWNTNNSMNFVNNRVVALHVGSEGWINERLSWLVKYTCSWNRGSYVEKYKNHYSWEVTPGYLFASTKMQHYSSVAIDKIMGMQKNVNIFVSLSYDFGDLYHSLGGQIGIGYNFGSAKR